MNVAGVAHRSLRETEDGSAVLVVDQTRLPGAFVETRLATVEDVLRAIRSMQVRGAPLIGVTAAYGLALALRADPSDAGLEGASRLLAAARPTAINLRWALDRVGSAVEALPGPKRAGAAWTAANSLAEQEVAACESIGRHGGAMLRERLAERGGNQPLQVLTHCNAGWLATVDWGTALAPIYRLHDEGVAVHVWVSETRPRNQGLLTAWELGQHGVPCTLVVDNAAYHLMQRSQVDICMVGADRITRRGDVVNKIGTALKALAARDAGVPFHVAAPSSTIDWAVNDPAEIPIEERSPREVTEDPGVAVSNPGFDLTPARLVSSLVTEHGVCAATGPALAELRRGAAA